MPTARASRAATAWPRSIVSRVPRRRHRDRHRQDRAQPVDHVEAEQHRDAEPVALDREPLQAVDLRRVGDEQQRARPRRAPSAASTVAGWRRRPPTPVAVDRVAERRRSRSTGSAARPSRPSSSRRSARRPATGSSARRTSHAAPPAGLRRMVPDEVRVYASSLSPQDRARLLGDVTIMRGGGSQALRLLARAMDSPARSRRSPPRCRRGARGARAAASWACAVRSAALAARSLASSIRVLISRSMRRAYPRGPSVHGRFDTSMTPHYGSTAVAIRQSC